nr:MAG TPA: hypothetical protein [Caudoviricetes sp.]
MIKVPVKVELTTEGRGQISFGGQQTQSPPWSSSRTCKNDENGN